MSGTAQLKELFSAANEGGGSQLPAVAREDAAHADLKQQAAGFAVYIHVPFCRVRCGYCDFNTYVNGFGAGADRASYHDSARRELALAAQFLRQQKLVPPPASSVYFGGGTPTMLSVRALRAILEEVGDTWGIAPGTEVSIEANPDTITEQVAQELAASGFTRVSLGMQSAVPQVLVTLERTHRPENLPQAVAALRGAGLAVSLDLIYGTPGESLADWEASLQAALALEVDHISAYSLVIEPGTKMHALVEHGKLSPIDPDSQAEKYEMADSLLKAAGYEWYEISNWAKRLEVEKLPSPQIPDATYLANASRHNLAYWRDWNWWGIGPGAHSHLGQVRWWNWKHPRGYASRVAAGDLPVQDGEVVAAASRELERVMLGLRTAAGVKSLRADERAQLPALVAAGYLDEAAARRGEAILTLRGRLMADYVTGQLLGW
ncbi:radical SAM family heme chaperone HemW [Varibaculum cambriense]|uniref:radical SAM family heme chaperone HemW n=1 Tax=Varibaculum cambriense TaxID=184870 RepID=UPI000C7976BB|nr:radical SAM family heme chaperone HemW [Varibaculum cambriense]WIK87844.1 radical SAM family heme chaperone HemW [Varibaculum cambriense]